MRFPTITAVLLSTVLTAQDAGTLSRKHNLDFEDGLRDWNKTGSAFDAQPVAGEKFLTDRGRAVKLGGDYWRGLPYPIGHHGEHFIFTLEKTSSPGISTLVSDEIQLGADVHYFSALIGGTNDLEGERIELQILAKSAVDFNVMEHQFMTWAEGNKVAAASLRNGKPIRDGGALVVFSATGLNSEFLRQEVFEIPEFLRGRSARVKIVDAALNGHINADFIQFTASRPALHSAPVWGFADYHTHPMTHMGFGALHSVRTVWGVPGEAFEKYEHDPFLVNRDIPYCIPGHGGGPTAEVLINSVESRIKQAGTLQSLLDLVSCRLNAHDRYGGPTFRNFPSFLSGAHQQMHVTQIRRAYDGGQRLMVALAVGNAGVEYLTSKVTQGTISPPSREIEVVEAQICGMRQLAELNPDWMEIAYSPEDARRIIRSNRMAVIQAIEVDQLGQLRDGNLEREVEYLWELGIRQVIPIHAVNNRLGGASAFEDAYNSLNDLLYRKQWNLPASQALTWPKYFFEVEEGCPGGPSADQRGECALVRLKDPANRAVIARPPFAFGRRAPFFKDVPLGYITSLNGHKNVRGLTEDGREYIRLMMLRGMLVDLAHMSQNSVNDVYGVIAERLQATGHSDCRAFASGTAPAACYADAYPFLVSHAHFRALSIQDRNNTTVEGFLPSEYRISDRQIDMLRRVGGVVGPFVTETPIDLPKDPHFIQPSVPFENDCAMSSKGFGYSFLYALYKMGGRGVGLATDVTIISLVAPRFGLQACWAYQQALDPAAERRKQPAQYNIEGQRYGVVYSTEGSCPAGVQSETNGQLCPYKMGERVYDFNKDGLAHVGLVPDMLQDLKNLGMTRDAFTSLFSSAEDYLQMWEKALKVSGLKPMGQFNPRALNCDEVCKGLCPKSKNAGAPPGPAR